MVANKLKDYVSVIEHQTYITITEYMLYHVKARIHQIPTKVQHKAGRERKRKKNDTR